MTDRRREPGDGARQPSPAEYVGHGLTLAGSTLLFLWLGMRVDGWLGTGPWLSLVGAFVGAGAGFYHMVHHLLVPPPTDRSGEEGEGE